MIRRSSFKCTLDCHELAKPRTLKNDGTQSAVGMCGVFKSCSCGFVPVIGDAVNLLRCCSI